MVLRRMRRGVTTQSRQSHFQIFNSLRDFLSFLSSIGSLLIQTLKDHFVKLKIF